MAIEITDANFEELVVKSDKPVMIDFWAVWCGPCRMIAPIVEEMSGEYEGKAVIGKVDVDSNPEVAMKYGIRNIPTVLFVKNGEVAELAIKRDAIIITLDSDFLTLKKQLQQQSRIIYIKIHPRNPKKIAGIIQNYLKDAIDNLKNPGKLTITENDIDFLPP